MTTIEEPSQTRDHTERMMPEFGAQFTRNGKAIGIQGGVQLESCDLSIPGDISSAAFFIAAAAALPGSDLRIRDVGLNPTRTAFLSALRGMGATIDVVDERLQGGEQVGTIHVRGVKLNEPAQLHISGVAVATLIDELPLLAFLTASLVAR